MAAIPLESRSRSISPRFTSPKLPPRRPRRRSGQETYVKLPIEAPMFGGTGAPSGMFTMCGSGLNVALLNVTSNFPIVNGPSTVSPFFTKVIEDDGCVHSEPWKPSLLPTSVIAVVLDARGAIVSIDLLALVPCQFVQSHGGP